MCASFPTVQSSNPNCFYRDAGIIAIGHFVWSILGIIFVFSLLGISHNNQSINIDQLRSNAGSWV